jgi:uncharacterized protein YecT (DUF1311 family)
MTTNNLKRLVVLPVIILLTSFGQASPQHMNAKDSPCQAVGTGADETKCFIDEAHRADMELNLQYNRIRQVLGPAEQRQLQAAQRLWIQFRDANCTAERDLYGGGSAGPMTYQACLAADTRQRTAELGVMYGWRLEKFAT